MNKENLARFCRSVWFFPVLLFLLVCFLTAFKISGSSVGMYNEFFYGTNYHDPNLLEGQPRPVRSDEWLVVTPMTVSQTRNHLVSNNPTIGDGQNMAAVGDAPHKSWDTIFTPQNWSFFFMPVEFAFAFKWWILAFGLVVSCYFFILAMLPGRRWFATYVSIALFFAPYIQWWYQTITIVPFIYGFLSLTAFIRFLESKTTKQRATWISLVVYSVIALIFAQYPPFVIPVFIATAGAGVGYFLEHYKMQHKTWKRTIKYLGSAAGAIIAILLLFIATRATALKLEAQTEYPGKRAAELLHLNVWNLFGGFLSLQLQYADKAIHYISNQSESSNFIMVAPFLLIPSAYIIYRSFKKKNHDERRYSLLILNCLLVLFAVRFIIPINGTGLIDSVLRIVPNNRILLGIGYVAFLQFILLARDQEKYKYPAWIKKTGMWATFFILAFVGFVIRHKYHGYIENGSKILLLAAVMALIYRFTVEKRLIFAALLLLAISFCSSYKVNPLYHGLSPLINSPLSHEVTTINNKKPGTWIVVDSLEYNTYLQAQGIRTISGVYQYPQFNIWKQLDPTGTYKPVYNRYAQVIFSQWSPAPFYLVQNDWFDVKFSGCNQFVQQRASYILSAYPIEDTTCLTHLNDVKLPAKTFYIYKTNQIHA